MNFSGGRGFAFGMQMPPDGFSTANFPLKALIQFAYGVQNYQISGGPDWISTEHFDIDAKMDSSVADALAKLSPEDRNRARQHMLQLLLEDRFHLTIHRDTKDLPVYTLVIAKNGPKLQESKPGDTPITAPKSPNSGEAMQISKGSIQMNFSGDGMRHISGPAISTAGLATMLSAQLGRPVFDKTGLTGKYDVTLQCGARSNPIFAGHVERHGFLRCNRSWWRVYFHRHSRTTRFEIGSGKRPSRNHRHRSRGKTLGKLIADRRRFAPHLRAKRRYTNEGKHERPGL